MKLSIEKLNHLVLILFLLTIPVCSTHAQKKKVVRRTNTTKRVTKKVVKKPEYFGFYGEDDYFGVIDKIEGLGYTERNYMSKLNDSTEVVTLKRPYDDDSNYRVFYTPGTRDLHFIVYTDKSPVLGSLYEFEKHVGSDKRRPDEYDEDHSATWYYENGYYKVERSGAEFKIWWSFYH